MFEQPSEACTPSRAQHSPGDLLEVAAAGCFSLVQPASTEHIPGRLELATLYWGSFAVPPRLQMRGIRPGSRVGGDRSTVWSTLKLRPLELSRHLGTAMALPKSIMKPTSWRGAFIYMAVAHGLLLEEAECVLTLTEAVLRSGESAVKSAPTNPPPFRTSVLDPEGSVSLAVRVRIGIAVTKDSTEATPKPT